MYVLLSIIPRASDLSENCNTWWRRVLDFKEILLLNYLFLVAYRIYSNFNVSVLGYNYGGLLESWNSRFWSPLDTFDSSVVVSPVLHKIRMRNAFDLNFFSSSETPPITEIDKTLSISRNLSIYATLIFFSAIFTIFHPFGIIVLHRSAVMFCWIGVQEGFTKISELLCILDKVLSSRREINWQWGRFRSVQNILLQLCVHCTNRRKLLRAK